MAANPQATRLHKLIAATHQRGVALGARLRKHPTAAGKRLLTALENLNKTRRAELNKIEHPHAPARTISRNGINFIKGFEGFSATQYNDGTGTMTIGYGTTAADVRPLPTHLTESQASVLLATKLREKYLPSVLALKVPLTQNQLDALVSFTYNLGPGIIAKGTHMGDLLRSRQYKAAADLMLQYDHAGGQELAGLKRRREAERALFLK